MPGRRSSRSTHLHDKFRTQRRAGDGGTRQRPAGVDPRIHQIVGTGHGQFGGIGTRGKALDPDDAARNGKRRIGAGHSQRPGIERARHHFPDSLGIQRQSLIDAARDDREGNRIQRRDPRLFQRQHAGAVQRADDGARRKPPAFELHVQIRATVQRRIGRFGEQQLRGIGPLDGETALHADAVGIAPEGQFGIGATTEHIALDRINLDL